MCIRDSAYTEVDGALKLADAAKTNGAAGTISLLFIAFAMVFGLVQKKFQFRGWKETVLGLVLTVAALALGMLAPITAGKDTWTYITSVSYTHLDVYKRQVRWSDCRRRFERATQREHEKTSPLAACSAGTRNSCIFCCRCI